MGKVKALVITGFGLNCEKETSAAFEYVGAEATQVSVFAHFLKSFIL